MLMAMITWSLITITYNYISACEATELCPPTLSLSSPPTPDDLHCRMLLHSFPLIHLQKHSAHICPLPNWYAHLLLCLWHILYTYCVPAYSPVMLINAITATVFCTHSIHNKLFYNQYFECWLSPFVSSVSILYVLCMYILYVLCHLVCIMYICCMYANMFYPYVCMNSSASDSHFSSSHSSLSSSFCTSWSWKCCMSKKIWTCYYVLRMGLHSLSNL